MKKAKRKQCKKRADSIIYPLRGAIALLEVGTFDKDINLATVHRALNWCWSTYDYLFKGLGPYRQDVEYWLFYLERSINMYDFSEHRTEDLYTQALIALEDRSN